MVPIKYNVRNLIVRKTTTIAAAGGLALVVFVVATVLMMGNGIKRAFGRAASPDVAIVLRKGSSAEMESGIEEKPDGISSLAQAAQVGASRQPVGVGEIIVVVMIEKIGTGVASSKRHRSRRPRGRDEIPHEREAHRRQDADAGAPRKPHRQRLRGRFAGMDLGERRSS